MGGAINIYPFSISETLSFITLFVNMTKKISIKIRLKTYTSILPWGIFPYFIIINFLNDQIAT